MNTLDYYLSEKGISHFEKWYSNLQILKPIKEDLDNYIFMLQTTRWSDETNHDKNKIRDSIHEYLELFIKLTFKKSAMEIFQEWIDSIKVYCFQGGYGYAISYPGAPHHWVIRPEYYEQVTNIPEYVYLASCVANQYIDIANVTEWENWSG